MKTCVIVFLLLLCGCEKSNPDRKKIEEVAKRNPLDMANEDAQTIVLKKEQKKPQYPKVATLEAKDAPYVAGKSSRIYHVRNCEYAGKINTLVGFASVGDAERSGHIPCEFCNPRANAVSQPADRGTK